MKFFITVERGLEKLIADDVRALGLKAWVENRLGKIFAEGEENHVFLLNFICRSINKVFILLKRAEIDSLRDVERELADINWEDYIARDQTFAVSVEKAGRKDFSSLELARLAGNMIIKRIMNFRERPKVNLKNPDVRIRIDIFRKDMLVGIDTTGASLHMRRYRVFNHPKAVKTTIAYLMIKLSSWRETESLYDPTCGGGTIPIEAAILCRRIPIFVFRGEEYALYKLKFLPLYKIEQIKKNLLATADMSKICDISGSDINAKYVEGAIKNARKAMVLNTIRFFKADVLNLNESRKFDKIVLNPPYYVKGGEILYFYRRLLTKLREIVAEEGCIVILTPRIREMKKILDEMKAEYNSYIFYRQRMMKNGIFIIKT